MNRHLANPQSIAKLRAARAGVGAERSKAPQNSGLTKEETSKAISTISRTEYKIPEALVPKAPVK